MSASQTFSTHDLRSASIDYKRFHDAQKWKHGVTYGPGRTNPEHGRPVKLTSRSVSPKPYKPKIHASKMAQKRDIQTATEAFSSGSDSSADEDIVEPSAAPIPGAETVYYSFDAQYGPSRGSQILNAALAKAIDQFESSATDKIVKEEYDVLDAEGESVSESARGRGRKGRKGRGSAAEPAAAVIVEDDDYEFV